MKRDIRDLEGRRFAEEIGKRERRRRDPGAPSALGAIGIIGWTVTAPMLAGVALGRWIDGWAGGRWSFTIMLMIGGLFLGCATAWNWARKRLGLGRDLRSPSEKEGPEDEAGGEKEEPR